MAEGDREGREQQLRACHQRSADKLLKLCFDNGGIYIKLGQHIGQLVSYLWREKGLGGLCCALRSCTHSRSRVGSCHGSTMTAVAA